MLQRRVGRRGVPGAHGDRTETLRLGEQNSGYGLTELGLQELRCLVEFRSEA